MYADSSHANARCCYSGGYRYFGPVESSTGRRRLNFEKTVCGSQKGYPGIEPGNSTRCVLTTPSGFPRSVNKYRKDFCQPVTLAAQLFDSYTIDIAPSAISSKYF